MTAPAELRDPAGALLLCEVFVPDFASPTGAVSVLLGANFLRLAWKTYRMADGDSKMLPARKLFGFSILYLFALFAVLLAGAVATRLGFPGVV